MPLVAKRKCTTELDHQRQMDSNFGSWGRQLTGGRASAKRKAKRMTYPVRIPDCLQFDGTGSVSNSDYDRNPFERRRNRSLTPPSDAKKRSSSTTVISMTRRRCITATATFRKTKVAQSSGTECSSGSKYHSFDTTAAPVSGRVDENKSRRCRDKTPLIIRGPRKQPLTVRHVNQVLIEGTELHSLSVGIYASTPN